MRGILTAACVAAVIAVCVAGGSSAQAESGGFFKNLLGGGDRGAADGMPAIGAPKLYDPNDVYCPNVGIREGGAAIQAYAGAPGDSSRLRDQITFARLSRECGPRPDGALAVKVGVELRALLGPAGSAGSFEAPLTVTVKAGDKVLETRTRHVRITVPAGAAQGSAAMIEDGFVVPAAHATDYDIEVALAGAAARKAPKVAARRGGKPASTEASAGTAPAADQAGQ